MTDETNNEGAAPAAETNNEGAAPAAETQPKASGPFPVLQDVFTKHAQRLWSMEAHISNLPDGPEKESLKADFHEWHKELAEDYASLTDAEGNQPQPLSGGTNKDNAPA